MPQDHDRITPDPGAEREPRDRDSRRNRKGDEPSCPQPRKQRQSEKEESSEERRTCRGHEKWPFRPDMNPTMARQP